MTFSSSPQPIDDSSATWTNTHYNLDTPGSYRLHDLPLSKGTSANIVAEIVELSAAREAMQKEENDGPVFSSAVHRCFWAMVSIFLLSFCLSAAAVVFENRAVSILGAFALASGFIAALIWIERAAREFQRQS
ncbi:MAG: hypothetical protein KI785_12860 [Devosiaceae bacterium]|nr:hypothetical protein [Devosiaceae bacterium MH13]